MRLCFVLLCQGAFPLPMGLLLHVSVGIQTAETTVRLVAHKRGGSLAKRTLTSGCGRARQRGVAGSARGVEMLGLAAGTRRGTEAQPTGFVVGLYGGDLGRGVRRTRLVGVLRRGWPARQTPEFAGVAGRRGHSPRV